MSQSAGHGSDADPVATDDKQIIVTVSGVCTASEAELQATFHAADSNRAQAHVLNALAELRRGDAE